MARRYDRVESERLLVQASIVEFAQSGIGGARIEKIADRAGVNKASIYAYIGNKEDLFEAALQTKLGELAHTVAIRSDDVSSYAVDLFDFLTENPVVAWLFEQEALYYGSADVPAFEARAGYFQSRVHAVREALGEGGDAEATYFAIIAMCYWFVAAPQMVRMVFPDVPEAEVKTRYRERIRATARSMLAA